MRSFNKLVAVAAFLFIGAALAQNLGPPSGGSSAVKPGANLQAQPANPTGSTNATGLMMGLGSTCTITPISTGKIVIQFYGNVKNSVASGNTQIKIFFGTGTAPANQAAITGTQVGTLSSLDEVTGAFNEQYAGGGQTPAQTLNTAVWFDVSVAASTGTSSIINVSCTAFEVP